MDVKENSRENSKQFHFVFLKEQKVTNKCIAVSFQKNDKGCRVYVKLIGTIFTNVLNIVYLSYSSKISYLSVIQ